MRKSLIVTYDDRFGDRPLREHAAMNPSSSGDRTMPRPELASGPVVAARVDHSRWIADCPIPSCGGAEMVSPAKPTFFCCECRNVAWLHRPLPVVFPANRAAVEDVLSLRPFADNRNWTKETPEELGVENDVAAIDGVFRLLGVIE